MKLRSYQANDAKQIRAAHRRVRRVLYVLPTGAGKTVVVTALILSEVRSKRRVLFLAHRRELINQAVTRLIDAGLPESHVGVLMADDARFRPDAPVQVASIDTIRRRAFRPAADLVVIDEAHRAAADTYQAVVAGYPDARILGLTATPWRMDGKGLAGSFDELVAGPSAEALIIDGHLSRPRIWTVPEDELPDLAPVRSLGGDYQAAELGKATNRPKLVGSIVDHWFRIADWRRTVVFAVDVAHSLRIAAAFLRAGVPVEHIDGTTPLRDRDAILARLESGETWVVTNVGVLTEGWDCPPVKCAILARPTRSKTLHLQMCGRILRPWGGIDPIILDHAGNMAHGTPHMARPLSLQAQRGYGESPCKTCPECFAVTLVGDAVCDECSFVWPKTEAGPIEEVDGELVEMSAGDRAALSRVAQVAAARGLGLEWVEMVGKAMLGPRQ